MDMLGNLSGTESTADVAVFVVTVSMLSEALSSLRTNRRVDKLQR